MDSDIDTICVLRKIEKQIKFPQQLYDYITSKAKNVVAIIPKDLRKILIFPTNTEQGLYCKIILKRKSKLDDSFFIELREKLAIFNIKTLYTTGVCFSSEECFWEGIFENTSDLDIEKFKKAIFDIKSVTDIKMEVLKPIDNQKI
jgi:hypothetical protein